MPRLGAVLAWFRPMYLRTYVCIHRWTIGPPSAKQALSDPNGPRAVDLNNVCISELDFCQGPKSGERTSRYTDAVVKICYARAFAAGDLAWPRGGSIVHHLRTVLRDVTHSGRHWLVRSRRPAFIQVRPSQGVHVAGIMTALGILFCLGRGRVT